MTDNDKLLTIKQAADVLGISYRTLYQWSWLKKQLPFIKVGRALRISESDLKNFIEKKKIEIEEE